MTAYDPVAFAAAVDAASRKIGDRVERAQWSGTPQFSVCFRCGSDDTHMTVGPSHGEVASRECLECGWMWDRCDGEPLAMPVAAWLALLRRLGRE